MWRKGGGEYNDGGEVYGKLISLDSCNLESGCFVCGRVCVCVHAGVRACVCVGCLWLRPVTGIWSTPVTRCID